MKYLSFAFALLLSIGFFSPQAEAAYGLTKSANFVAASSQFLSAAHTASLTPSPIITLETWVYFTSIPGNQTTYFMWEGDGQSNVNLAWGLAIVDTAGAKTLKGLVGDGANNDQLSVSWTPSTATWYHVAMSYNGGTKNMNFYVNGAQQGTTQTGTVATINSDAIGVTIGALYNGSLASPFRTNFFDGRLSLARVWSTERSAGQLSANMCNVFGGATAGMNVEWSLNNVLTDASGNGNTLANNNTVTFVSDVPSTCQTAVSSFQLWFLSLF